MVRFLKNLSKLFLKADEISHNQRIDDNLPEMAIPNTQTMFKELNDKKIPGELNFIWEEMTVAMNSNFMQC